MKKKIKKMSEKEEWARGKKKSKLVLSSYKSTPISFLQMKDGKSCTEQVTAGTCLLMNASITQAWKAGGGGGE